MKRRIGTFLFIIVFCCCSLTGFFSAVSTAETVSLAKSYGLDLSEVTVEVRELFYKGIPASDFVRMSDDVPRALEGFAKGDTLVIIELIEAPLAKHKTFRKKQGLGMTPDFKKAYLQELEQNQNNLSKELRAMGVSIFSNYTTLYNGFLARVPYRHLQAVRTTPGVRAVHPAPIHKPRLQASVPLMGATDVWQGVDGVDGEGVVIAIIDTGIDYTHISLGGSGDPQDYDVIEPSQDAPGFFPNNKVVGGYDFAGTLYDADCTQEQESAGICSNNPNPDGNPLDEWGHGTHVAAIAAGLKTKTSDPGVAPGAKLMALKVFGRSGTTALTIDALEWAARHYMHHGYPHVINMSIDSKFGTGNDPCAVAANNAADLGIIVVASAGDAGDMHYITGSPGAADKVISVAAATTGYITGPSITGTGFDPIVYQPGNFDDGTGQFTQQIETVLSYAGSLDGAQNNQLCSITEIFAGALSGNIALIQRGGCTFTTKINNAANLGAKAVIIFNNTSDNYRMAMAGLPVDVPAGMIAYDDGLILKNKHGGIINVSAQDDVDRIPDPYTPADIIGIFSSRGPRGVDSFLKPEVSAPGVDISAAAMGTGTGRASMSGTSMAAAHVAGLAALVLEGKPGWTPEEVKALIMNTSVDLAEDVPIPRSGTGRADAVRAMESDVVAVGDDNLTSLNWGVVMTRSDSIQMEKQVVVHNKGHAQITYDLATVAHPASSKAGQHLAFPTKVKVDADSSETMTISLTLDMTGISSSYNNLEEYFGWITFTPEGGGNILRVPYYFHPKPFTGLSLQDRKGIVFPAQDQAEISIIHTGPIASDLSILPALYHNPSPDPSMGGPGDIRIFGMDHLGLTNSTYGDMLEIGISTWDYWHVPQPQFAEFNLYIDVNQNGKFDYLLFNYNLGRYQGGGNNNQWIVVQKDLATGILELGSPFLIYSDYNASYMKWRIPAQWLGLDEDDSVFDYQLLSLDSGSQELPKGSFDYKKSPLDWTIDDDSPGPGSSATTARIRVNDQAGYSYSRPLGAMLMDYMGDPRNIQGAQAYFIALERRIMDDYKTTLTSASVLQNEAFFFNVGFSLENYNVQAFCRSTGEEVHDLITTLNSDRFAFTSPNPGSYQIRVTSYSGSFTSMNILVIATGNLRVILNQEAREAGVKWRVKGQKQWNESNALITLAVGNHEIEFSSGRRSEETTIVNIKPGETLEIFVELTRSTVSPGIFMLLLDDA